MVQSDRRRLFWPAAFALVAVGVLVAAGVTDTSPVAVALGGGHAGGARGPDAAGVPRQRPAARPRPVRGGHRRPDRPGQPAPAGARLRAARAGRRRLADRTLVLFDLDGFKAYNDAFGHPAGDALLTRLATQLGEAAAPHPAYRVGGDEFCVLIAADRLRAESVVEAGAAALVEQGEAFSITASYGAVSMPGEARSSELALQLADRRMYAHKERRRTSPSEQTRAALRALLDERSPAASAAPPGAGRPRLPDRRAPGSRATRPRPPDPRRRAARRGPRGAARRAGGEQPGGPAGRPADPDRRAHPHRRAGADPGGADRALAARALRRNRPPRRPGRAGDSGSARAYSRAAQAFSDRLGSGAKAATRARSSG